MTRHQSTRTSRCLTSAALIAVSVLASCASFSSPRQPRLHIMVVGADQSVSTHGGQLGRRLQETANDRGWSTDLDVSLVAERATAVAFNRQLGAAIRRLEPDTEDTLFLYVAGKGRCAGDGSSKRLLVELAGDDTLDLEVLAHKVELLGENRAMIVLDAQMPGIDGPRVQQALEVLPWVRARHAVWLTSDPTRRVDVVHNGIDLTAVLADCLTTRWVGDQGIDFRLACETVKEAAVAKTVPMQDGALVAPEDAVMFRRSGAAAR